MRRTVRLALGALFVFVASAALAQTSTELYPLKKDTKWVYKVGETTITVKVTSSDANGATLETLVNDKPVASEVINSTVFRPRSRTPLSCPPFKSIWLNAR